MSNTKVLHYFDQPSDSEYSMSDTYPDEQDDYLTPEVLDLFIAEILFEKKILPSMNLVASVLERVSQLFLSEETLISVSSPVTVVGDIHGQLPDLIRVLMLGELSVDEEKKVFEFPGEYKFLFMGDYVDRGYFSIEVVLLLFALKIKYPDRFFMLRGNHEMRDINMMYGFARHCSEVFKSLEAWENFNQVFDLIPISAVVDGKAFCVHGGISPSLPTLEEIRETNRLHVPMHQGIFEMLWSDPSDYISDFRESPRGAGHLWGETATQTFLEKNNLDIIVRAHELQMEGFSYQHNQKVLTIFSAANYCYRLGNNAAILKIEDGKHNIITLSPF